VPGSWHFPRFSYLTVREPAGPNPAR
jgi:hypothetical protein